MTPSRYVPWILALILGSLLYCQGRTAGSDKVQRQIAEAARDSAVRVSDSTARLAREALQSRDSALGVARISVRQSEALRTQTRASNAQASEARDHAESAIRDSASTLAVLRDALTNVVNDTRRDSVAAAQRFAQDSTTIARLLEVVRKDSLAIWGKEVQDSVTGRWRHKAGLLDANKALNDAIRAQVALTDIYKQAARGGWRKAAIAGIGVFVGCKYVLKCQ